MADLLLVMWQEVKTHQATVDTYLESIIAASIDDTADKQAKAEIEAQAEAINTLAYEVEERWVRDFLCKKNVRFITSITFLTVRNSMWYLIFLKKKKRKKSVSWQTLGVEKMWEYGEAH